MKQLFWLALMLVTCMGTNAGLHAQSKDTPSGFDCPDKAATNVDARTVEGGPRQRCGVGLRLFGLVIDIFGERCPEYRDTYPAHQECKGESAEGMQCTFETTVNVTREICDCDWVGIPGIELGITLPDCDCSPAGYQIGTLEDFKTQACN